LYLCAQVLCLFPVLIVDFLPYFLRTFRNICQRIFLRFMIRERPLPAIATDINIFELISTSYISRYLLAIWSWGLGPCGWGDAVYAAASWNGTCRCFHI